MTASALASVLALAAATQGAAGPSSVRYPAAQSVSVDGLRLTSEHDAGSALAGVQIFVSGGLARQTRMTNGVAALVAECVIRTPVNVPGTGSLALDDAVSRQGGSLTYSIDESTLHYYLESQPQRMPGLLELLGKALSAPDFSSATLASARRTLLARIDDSEKNPFRVGVQMFRESFLEGGMAYPDYGAATTVAGLAPSQLHEFYERTYRRGGVSASAIGEVTSEITSAIGNLAKSLPPGTVAPVRVAGRTLPASTTHIIAQRDVGRPFIVVGFAAPSPGQRDFGAMLVLETLLSSAFGESSATTLTLGERAVGALYLYDSTPASLVVYVNGGTGVDPVVALHTIAAVTKRLGEKPLSADALKRFKTAAEGEFVTGTTTLSDRSFLLGTLSTGLGQKSINGALDAIEAVTPADLQQAAKTYLQRYVEAIIAPRQTNQQQN